MAILEFELPEGSPDPCPNACGGLTEDPYGGPCKACWAATTQPRHEEPDDEDGWCCGGDGCIGECGDDVDWPDDVFRPVKTVAVEEGVL